MSPKTRFAACSLSHKRYILLCIYSVVVRKQLWHTCVGLLVRASYFSLRPACMQDLSGPPLYCSTTDTSSVEVRCLSLHWHRSRHRFLDDIFISTFTLRHLHLMFSSIYQITYSPDVQRARWQHFQLSCSFHIICGLPFLLNCFLFVNLFQWPMCLPLRYMYITMLQSKTSDPAWWTQARVFCHHLKIIPSN